MDYIHGRLYDYVAREYGRDVADLTVSVGNELGVYLGTRKRTRDGTIVQHTRTPETRVSDQRRPHTPVSESRPPPRRLTFHNDIGPPENMQGGAGSSKYVRGGSLVTGNNPLKMGLKIEKGLQQAGYNAVYVGGATHPAQPTFGIVVQAVIRFMALRANLDFGSLDEDMIAPGIGAHTFSFDYWWRQDTGSTTTALTLVSVASTGLNSWAQWVGTICDSLVATFGDGPTAVGPPVVTSPTRRLCYIALRGTALTPIVASQFYKAEELYISVKGESKIQVQNRTKAENATSGSEDAANVFANPLRGKYYTFKNGRPVVKSPANVQANQLTVFPYDSQSGNINKPDLTGTFPGTGDFPGPVAAALKKPPPGYFYSNCATQKYTTVEPGQILRSSIQHTVTHTLPNWMIRFRSKFLQTATKTYAGLLANSDPWDYKAGLSHMFGLEKMCDTAVAIQTNQVTVGLEHTLYISGVCEWKPKMGCVPQVNITTS